jgi:hypothetical protein
MSSDTAPTLSCSVGPEGLTGAPRSVPLRETSEKPDAMRRIGIFRTRDQPGHWRTTGTGRRTREAAATAGTPLALRTKAFKSYYNIRDPKEIQQRADSEVPLEKVYGDWPVSTDPAVHVKAIFELFDSGATIVNIHSGQEDQKRVIEFYGKEVLPRIKHG